MLTTEKTIRHLTPQAHTPSGDGQKPVAATPHKDLYLILTIYFQQQNEPRFASRHLVQL